MARNKWQYDRKIREHSGITCGDKPWDQVDRKVRALIYVSICHEERRMQTRSYRYVNVKRLTTKELWNQFEATRRKKRQSNNSIWH